MQTMEDKMWKIKRKVQIKIKSLTLSEMKKTADQCPSEILEECKNYYENLLKARQRQLMKHRWTDYQ